MYSGSSAKTILFGWLNNLALTSFIKGKLCFSDEREPGSDQDVVIGLINITDGSGQNNKQLADLNVNIYIKDIKKEFSTSYANVPDNDTFDIIVSTIQLILGDNAGVYWSDGSMHIVGISDAIKLEKTEEHFINIRVRMRLYSNN